MADDDNEPIDIDQKPIMRSGARAGFKRELAFALKSLSENDSNLAPVRLRKPPVPFCPTSTSLSPTLGKRAKPVRCSDTSKKRGKQVKAPSGDPFSPRCLMGTPVLVTETLEIFDDHGEPFVNVPINIDETPLIPEHASRFVRRESSYEIENLERETLFSVPVVHADSFKKVGILDDSSNVKDHQPVTGKDKGVVIYDLEENVDMDEDAEDLEEHVDMNQDAEDLEEHVDMNQDAEDLEEHVDMDEDDEEFTASYEPMQTISNQSHAASSSKLSGQTMELESPQCALPKGTVNGKLTKKDFGLHKLIFECGIYKNVEVTYRVNEEISLKGHIEDSGIYCDHCKNVVSASKFEAHAGCAQRRKPYHNTYTSEGKSLHEITLQLSAERNRESDTLCQMCKRSGILVQCDRCPRAYHKECTRLSSIPQSWVCPSCGKLFKREKSLGSRVQMVKAKVSKLSCCVLCRCKDFLKTGFGGRTIILCDQCDKEYHISCLKDNNMCDLKALPLGKWFCSDGCRRTNTALEELRRAGPKQLPAPALDVIKKKSEGRGLQMNVKTVLTWNLVHGITHDPILSRVVNIFRECFQPIIDNETGKDLITTMVYREKLGDHDFHGMHCAMLNVNSFVVCAALLRVLDHEVAEMPLVATCQEDQGMGYFQSLFYCVQKLLSDLEVKHFLIPAMKEAEPFWIKKYGFQKISQGKVKKLTKDLYPVLFDGTSLLYKSLPASQALPEGNGRS